MQRQDHAVRRPNAANRGLERHIAAPQPRGKLQNVELKEPGAAEPGESGRDGNVVDQDLHRINGGCRAGECFSGGYGRVGRTESHAEYHDRVARLRRHGLVPQGSSSGADYVIAAAPICP